MFVFFGWWFGSIGFWLFVLFVPLFVCLVVGWLVCWVVLLGGCWFVCLVGSLLVSFALFDYLFVCRVLVGFLALVCWLVALTGLFVGWFDWFVCLLV